VYSWKYVLLLVPVLVCGCRSAGFDRVALQQRLNDGTVQMPDATITEVRGLKPQMKFPCRIAVYLKPSNSQDWHWSPTDKAAMDVWIAALKKEGVVAEVFPLPEMLAGKGETKELRLAAAQCGADALFIVHGAAQTDSYKNVASVFNLTLVGGFIIPGSHKDSIFVVEGILLDVDNGYVYAGVQAEGVGKVIGPTFVIEEKDSVSVAKSKAVAQFGEEVLRRMRALASSPIAAPVPVQAVVPVPSMTKHPDMLPPISSDWRPPVYTADKPTGLTTSLTPGGVKPAGGMTTELAAPARRVKHEEK
jgi:hypothetical protein